MALNTSMASRIHSCACKYPFAVHAADVRRFLTSHELLVAHNAAFDLRFINREMRLSGLPALNSPVYCTMKGYRALDLGGSAALSAVCGHIKLARVGDLHDAIEDAWLAMQIYLWLHAARFRIDCAARFLAHPPTCVSLRSANTMSPDRGSTVPTFVKRTDKLNIHRLTFVIMDGR